MYSFCHFVHFKPGLQRVTFVPSPPSDSPIGSELYNPLAFVRATVSVLAEVIPP
jgi:hypothetical protein